jgi:hypothetical protein
MQLSISLFLAALVFSGPAAAQNWQEYGYPDYAFRVTFLRWRGERYLHRATGFPYISYILLFLLYPPASERMFSSSARRF